ncbi:hypothetical protein ACFXTI_005508 [Malus domestica]
MKKKERGKVGAVMNSWGKYGIIRETDMWNKRPEFTAWLLEVKLVNLEHLANWEEKQMFKQFMEDHSTASFPLKSECRCCKTQPEKGMKASNSTCYCDTQRDNYGVHTDAACTTQSAINSGVILGLCQQRRVLFTAHHYSVQHSSVAVLDFGLAADEARSKGYKLEIYVRRRLLEQLGIHAIISKMSNRTKAKIRVVLQMTTPTEGFSQP